jgi:hypothetical protein
MKIKQPFIFTKGCFGRTKRCFIFLKGCFIAAEADIAAAKRN